MSFTRPTLPQLIERVKADLRTSLGLQTTLRRSFEVVLTRAIAGVAHTMYGFLDFISKQVFPDTAVAEFLDRWATIWGVNRKVATFEQMLVLFTGTGGSTIPDGTSIQRIDGVLYTTDDEAEIPEPVTGVAEVTTITTVADVSNSLNNKYFLYNLPTGGHYFYTGADPALAGLTGHVFVPGTDSTAAQVATALRLVMDAVPGINAVVDDDEVTATNEATGAVEHASDSVGSSTGFSFNVDVAGVTEVIEEVLVACTAVDSGSSSGVSADDILTLVSPVTGVDSDCTVDSVTTTGEDTETDNDLRVRLFLRIRKPPLGGSANDYVQETLKVTGVTRAWVFPQWLGAGTVGVSFVLDNEDDPLPDSDKIDEVEEALEAFKPVTATLTVFAPVAYPMNPTIGISPNNADIRAAIEAEIKDLILRDGQVRGARAGFEETETGTILLSRINEAISIAAGEEDHDLVSPVADVTPNADGKLVTLGTITWQTL